MTIGGFLSDIEEMPIDEVVNRIIKLNDGLRYFWTKSDGWTPIEAAQLLSKSRLDWQVSLSRSLKIWLEDPLPNENDGRLILAWANLGSLVEGTMKLFLSVYYENYKKDIVMIKKSENFKDPDTLSLEPMRVFFNQKIWCSGDNWDTWISYIQQRRNAIHAYKNREIGTFDDFTKDIRIYFDFLKDINSRLPYPAGIYGPQDF